MAQAEKIRIYLEFSEEALDELRKLEERLQASCPAEVIRDALGVLRWVTNHLAEGDRILIKRGDGQQTETTFPFLRINQ